MNEEDISKEDNEKMLLFLKEMKELQENDPESFNKLLLSLSEGLKEEKDSKNINRESIIQALSQIQTLNNENINNEIELPGGKGTLSSEGIKNKMKGITITPEPGFTIKTRNESDSKIFINLCQHSELALPALKKKLNEEGEEIEGMNIPLSVGPARPGKDKSGVDCTIYDVIVNPQVVQDVLNDPTGKHRDFICQLAIQSVEQKYKLNLDKRYKLPKIRYLGEIASQLIQDRKNMPKIEEVEVKSTPKSTKNSTTTSKLSKTDTSSIPVNQPDRILGYTLHWRYEDKSEELYEDCTLISNQQSTNIDSKNNSNITIKSYIEPLTVPDDSIKSLVFRALVDIKSVTNLQNIELNVSTFKFSIKIPGYFPCSFYFPCAISVPSSPSPSPSSSSTLKSILHRVPGYTQVVELLIILPIDTTPWGNHPDPGSKPWLIAEALKDENSESTSNKSSTKITTNQQSDEYPEDKFHIKLPDNVDKYTGVKYETSPDEFPEDRFHRQDAISQYIIEQRERDIKEKWEKHEREKAERKNDPNVEYIDVEDFQPGGKYGPKVTATPNTSGKVKEELQRASEILASSVSKGEGRNLNENTNNGDNINSISLTSQLWTELLD